MQECKLAGNRQTTLRTHFQFELLETFYKKHSIETFWNENKLLVTFTTIF